jgi:cytochrome P450
MAVWFRSYQSASDKDTRKKGDVPFVLLVAAGNETTRNSIAGGFLALAEHPQKRRLLNDPSLMSSAASEIVRWVSPVMHMRRTALEPAEVGGQAVRPGDKMILWYCLVNRDESVFDQPSRFDVGRAEPSHLGFGAGQHFCLGARLGEAQIRIFFEEFLHRYPNAMPEGPVHRIRSNFVVGYKSILTRLHTASGG